MKNQDKIIGARRCFVDDIGSTNSELLHNIQRYEHGSVLRARIQTSGKGRNNRKWESDDGGLYFSILLKDFKNINAVYPFVLLCALSVVKSISTFTRADVSIKWPNDIYIDQRKVCGILSESISMGEVKHVVVGVGLNVNNAVADLNNLRQPAISLKEILGKTLNVDSLYQTLLDQIDLFYKSFAQNKFITFLPELNNHLYSKNKEIEVKSKNLIRKVTPIRFTEHATLRCSEQGKEVELFMGEM